ncbi:EDD domain protein, DegV family [Anaerovirgula multivorans]|uniref:EDD domain protein, DegV family n=1 Tax=Anaerovirgula multivorans TaxID=312168 RepID=A0A239FX31_9FIRM|nr:DegV family protein [Anaerovirgula multivorans]SNS61330.1 EDD domain protein, DegV family [Anaerovirgula multivorans]
MAIKILTDSTSYINESIRASLDIRIVSLIVEFEDITLKETEINNERFYEMMEKKGIPKSSQPSIGDLYNEMESVVKQGDDLVCIFLSSDMSGTYSSAHMAKNMIIENYPNANIEIADSRSNCMQLGFAAIVAARAAKENKTLNQVKQVVKENIKKSRFLFIPDNLKYLEKGGRIGRANAIMGDLLKIVPILTVENGVTTIFQKIRTKKKAVLTIVKQVLEDIKVLGLGEIVIHHINCIDEAKSVANQIKEVVDIDIKMQDIGPVIGLHVGPGAIGIAYYTKEDIR